MAVRHHWRVWLIALGTLRFKPVASIHLSQTDLRFARYRWWFEAATVVMRDDFGLKVG